MGSSGDSGTFSTQYPRAPPVIGPDPFGPVPSNPGMFFSFLSLPTLSTAQMPLPDQCMYTPFTSSMLPIFLSDGFDHLIKHRTCHDRGMPSVLFIHGSDSGTLSDMKKIEYCAEPANDLSNVQNARLSTPASPVCFRYLYVHCFYLPVQRAGIYPQVPGCLFPVPAVAPQRLNDKALLHGPDAYGAERIVAG